MERHVFPFHIEGLIELDANYLCHDAAYELAQEILSNFSGSSKAFVRYFSIASVNIEEECRRECEVLENLTDIEELEEEDDEEPHELLREEG